jgi:hypothetical protein
VGVQSARVRVGLPEEEGPVRFATLALTAICVVVLAPSSSAAPTLSGSDYLVTPGQTITFSGMTINSCDSDVAGVNIQTQGGVAMVNLGSNSGSECTVVTLDSQSFTNNTATDQTFRLWLSDNTCSFIYYADGSHAKVTPRHAALNDSGPGCQNLTSPSVPKGKHANFYVSVSIG